LSKEETKMLRQTTATAIVAAPADRIWATIAAGGGVHHWFGAVITACELRGSGPGAERFCTMADGADLKERILEIDADARRFRYAIDEHPLPAREVVAAMEVEDLGDGTARITWGAQYEADDAHADLVDQTLSGLYAQGIQSLDHHCRVPA
jgi:uncharacterized protein YndB with AHSA1/START domain